MNEYTYIRRESIGLPTSEGYLGLTMVYGTLSSWLDLGERCVTTLTRGAFILPDGCLSSHSDLCITFVDQIR